MRRESPGLEDWLLEKKEPVKVRLVDSVVWLSLKIYIVDTRTKLQSIIPSPHRNFSQTTVKKKWKISRESLSLLGNE